jgi:hypothetical protein
MGMASGAVGALGGYGLGKLGTAAFNTALGWAGRALPFGPLKLGSTTPMTAEQWKTLARQKYAEAESHGVIFNQAGLIHLRDQIMQELRDKGYHPNNQPGLTGTLQTLDDYIRTGAATQRAMQTLREMTSGGWQFQNKKNNMLVGKVIDEIDKLALNMDPRFTVVPNNPAAAAAAKTARDAYHTGAQLQTVNNLIERGTLQGETNISKNVRQSVRKQIAKIADPTRQIGRGWSPVQKEAIKSAVKTTTAQDIAHGLSSLMPRDKLSTAVSLGTLGPAVYGGLVAGGPVGAVVAPLAVMTAKMGLGMAAEKWANRMAQKSIDELIHVISTGQTSKAAAQSILQKLAASKRQAVISGLARLGAGIGTATQPFNQDASQNAQ